MTDQETDGKIVNPERSVLLFASSCLVVTVSVGALRALNQFEKASGDTRIVDVGAPLFTLYESIGVGLLSIIVIAVYIYMMKSGQ